MKPEYLMTRLLAVHEEYLTRGPKGKQARQAIEREFENLKGKALHSMTVGFNILSQVDTSDLVKP